MKQKIVRTGDLIAKGIKSTIDHGYSNTEKFERLCELKKELEIKLYS